MTTRARKPKKPIITYMLVPDDGSLDAIFNQLLKEQAKAASQ